MTEILTAHQLQKTYPGVTAVDGIDLSVAEGICFGLLGPNGAGKTTTVEMLEGITPPSGGEIRYRGRPIDAHFRQIVGIQFQNTALQDYLSVRETLNLFHRFYRRTRPIDELIQLCALEGFIDRDTRKLSGGQRQRLLLALALINDPEIVFLDEPTTGLDPQARRNFWDLIRAIKAERKTIVLTTHYMEEAQLLCDEIAIMDHGRVIERGSPQTLLQRHFSGAMIRLRANGEAETVARGLSDDVALKNGYLEIQSETVDATLRGLMQQGVILEELHIQSPNLEDLFLKLTGHALRS